MQSYLCNFAKFSAIQYKPTVLVTKMHLKKFEEASFGLRNMSTYGILLN